MEREKGRGIERYIRSNSCKGTTLKGDDQWAVKSGECRRRITRRTKKRLGFRRGKPSPRAPPVTPPFATIDELVDYLATRGDFWDQERGDGPWDRKSAEVVKAGWAPTLIVTGKRIITARRWRIVGPRPLSSSCGRPPKDNNDAPS